MTLSGSPAARTRAADRWSAVADRAMSVTPSALARGAIAAGLVTAGAWLSVATWPALLPFLAGAVIAYAVLPVANRLDRFMPRVIAALLAEGLALALLLGVTVIVVPPLLRSLVRVAMLLPTGDQVEAWVASLQTQLGDLPEPIHTIVLGVLTETATNLSAALTGLVEGAGDFLTQQILGAAGTATFLLGLLVIPVWILTIVADERTIKRRAVGFVAPAVRTDVVAGFRIVDRALSTFLRAQVLVAVATGAFVWIGFEILQALGVAEYPYALAGAVLLGSLQLIPQLGFFLGLFPLLLVLAVSGPVPALGAGAVYLIATRAASTLLQGRLSRGVLDVHPALLIPAIVVLSEFGLIWLLAAAPAVAIVRDLARYASGRLDVPPAPAGVLPGERRREAVAVPPSGAVPSVYRDRVAARTAAVTAGAVATTTARSLLP
jgi:predicted PurR-regulated permease PerM